MCSFLIINFLLLSGWYLYCSALMVKPLSTRLVLTGLFYFSQIILSQLFLGLLGLLTSAWIISINLVFTILILIHTLKQEKDLREIIRADLFTISQVREILSWENISMLVLTLLASVWIVLAIALLPPRGVDDLTYHLPRIYEYWQQHKMTLLPSQHIPNAAFPENAELLFLWPIVFFHTQQWAEGGQFIFGLYGIFCLFALARLHHLSRRQALFLALLFFLSPIVLMQMGVAYIDLIVAVTFLGAMVCALSFQKTERILFLYATALALGLGIGMKYTFLILAAYLQIIIWPRLGRFPLKHWIGYTLVMLLAGGYYYGRNLLTIQHPISDFSYFYDQITAATASPQDFFPATLARIRIIGEKLFLIILKDHWLTTFNGGFGAVFWGLAFPSWLVAAPRVFQKLRHSQIKPFFLWLIVPLGIGLLLLWPLNELQDVIRISLFIIPFGLLFLGETFKWLQRHKPLTNGLRFLGVFLSFLSFATMASSYHPGYRVDIALKDRLVHKRTSEFKYLQESGWIRPWLRFVAEPLDFLTLPPDPGIDCYLASDMDLGPITVYGTHLQNRIWNFKTNNEPRPEAYIYLRLLGRPINYIRTPVPLKQAIRDPELITITSSAKTWLLFDRQALLKADRLPRLLQYYRLTFMDEINAASQITKACQKNIPIVTGSSSLGHGLRFAQLTHQLDNPLYWLPPGLQDAFLDEKKWRIVYSIDQPLAGYQAMRIKTIASGKSQFTLWENTK